MEVAARGSQKKVGRTRKKDVSRVWEDVEKAVEEYVEQDLANLEFVSVNSDQAPKLL